MQRLITWMAVLALTFAMVMNIVLFMQNTQLRQQTSNAPPQPQPTQAPAVQPQELADLRQQLDRAEKDRIKADREAKSMHEQFNQLQAAAKERDTLKQQVQSLGQ
jgi:uncharacterized protein YlxW (UPF0749 family)